MIHTVLEVIRAQIKGRKRRRKISTTKAIKRADAITVKETDGDEEVNGDIEMAEEMSPASSKIMEGCRADRKI